MRSAGHFNSTGVNVRNPVMKTGDNVLRTTAAQEEEPGDEETGVWRSREDSRAEAVLGGARLCPAEKPWAGRCHLGL